MADWPAPVSSTLTPSWCPGALASIDLPADVSWKRMTPSSFTPSVCVRPVAIWVPWEDTVARTRQAAIEKRARSELSEAAVERLEAAGAVLIGKTNCDEFAMGSSNENSGYGPVRNPRDLTRVPGGSSGGSAAAVAADMAVFTLGSDTGGSIRVPAASCGLFGLRPSHGVIDARGVLPLAPSFDVVGLMTRDAATLRRAFGVLPAIPLAPPGRVREVRLASDCLPALSPAAA